MAKQPRCKSCGYTLHMSPTELAALLERAPSEEIREKKKSEDVTERAGAYCEELGWRTAMMEIAAAKLLGFCGIECRRNKRNLEQLDAFKSAAKPSGVLP